MPAARSSCAATVLAALSSQRPRATWLLLCSHILPATSFLCSHRDSTFAAFTLLHREWPRHRSWTTKGLAPAGAAADAPSLIEVQRYQPLRTILRKKLRIDFQIRVVHTRACVVQTPPLSTSTYSVGTIAWCLRVSDCTASIPRRALSVLPQRRAMRSRSSVRTRWLWRMIAWIGLSTAAIARNHRWCGSGSSRATTRSPSHGTVCWASPSQGARESWAMRRVKD